MKIKILSLLLLISILLPSQNITATYPNGAVVTAHPLASEVGIEILKEGGNAIDAAVAVQFALSVVYPNAGNIGGGGFMVYRSAKGETAALDYRETAPEKAHHDMYLDENGNAITDKSLYGGLAAGVPGTVAGMVEAHKKYGKLAWSKLLEPAIELARNGFQITDMQVDELNRNQEFFIKYNPDGCALIKNQGWNKGDTLKQPDLANTLKLIAEKGCDGFYRGEVADKIVAEMQRSNGIITHSDLEKYKAVWRNPVTADYKNYKVISMPPPSSGGIALITLLKAIEKYPVSKWGFQEDSTIQLIVEAERRVYADRAEYLGDPDFFKVPQEELLEANYIVRRMSDIDFTKATPSFEIKPIGFMPYESDQTTHYSIIDKDRNAVSITTTLNGSYGSKVVVGGAGFLLNNEMDDFSVKPGIPNMYGLVGNEANSILAGKRMLSSMTPTILEKEGSLYMVVGTPGGSTIITSVFQAIINNIEHGLSAQESVSAPRFHHQWLPDEIQVEDGAISESTRKYLETKGYKITSRKPFGRIESVIVKPDNTLEGGADPRGDDTVAGY